jgi:hypothetical protein
MVATLADVARPLYDLAPQDFTAARNSTARELKSADAALAKQVAALRKPSPAAWVVNLLARRSADGMAELVRLGQQMRAAQEQFDRDALRRLGTQRRDAVAALAGAGAELAAGHGHPPTGAVLTEIEQTLQAATSDDEAAAAVSSGLLVRALRAVGFEPVDLDGAVAVPGAATAVLPAPSSDPPKSPVQLADVRRRKEARLEAERQERDAEAATAELDSLDRRAHRLDLRRTSLEAEISDLREQLDTAEAALRTAAAEAATLAETRERAEAAVEEASRRAVEARAAADALDASD